MQDIHLVCVKCDTPFDWTVGEQRFMEKLVEDHKIDRVTQPKLCPECRAERKKRKEEATQSRW